ncbi:MAG: hypothetical protein GX946_02370 [Oligosphaeraceae bacterium]|nr:hypothetical protein [Oligosphaeraceae bacterium]
MLILIADSHVCEKSQAKFEAMLQCISESPHDVCFLGDIMELWIALDKFETACHRQFLHWCQTEKNKRQVFFIEGNHEFFVTKRYGQHFSACGQNILKQNNCLFCHGDLIPRRQLDHLLFRRLSKSIFCYLLLRYLPGAPKIVNAIQSKMRRKNRCRTNLFPLQDIMKWLRKLKLSPEKQVFLGHFHHAHQEQQAGQADLYCLPAWSESGQVALFNPETRSCEFLPWQSISTK